MLINNIQWILWTIHLHQILYYRLGLYYRLHRTVSSNSAPRGKISFGITGSILSANKATPLLLKTKAFGGNCPLCPSPLTRLWGYIRYCLIPTVRLYFPETEHVEYPSIYIGGLIVLYIKFKNKNEK